jgi:hypothetical protein
MAVIKIVPMPGAVGDKGDEGAPGPQGPQGQQGLQGPAGADALWSYNGAWQANAAYAIGDLVTYQGQLYYTKAITTAGTLPTDTSKFDLIAAKGTNGTNGTNGADFNSTNGLVVTGYIDDAEINPAGTMSLNVGPGYAALMDLSAHSATFNGDVQITNLSGTRVTTIETPTRINNDLNVEGFSKTPGAVADALKVKGITNDGPGNLYIGASDTIWLTANNGEYIDRPYGPEDRQIAALGDIKSIFESGTWDTNIKGQSQISGGVTLGLDNPGFGSYYCVGDLVTFEFRYNLSDSPIGGGSYSPITFNSSVDSGFSFKLPFPIREPYQGGVASNGYHYAANEYIFRGNFFGRVDSNPLPGFNMPDEEGWVNVNGIGFTNETDPTNRQSYVIFDIPEDAESINTNVKTNRRMTHQWPFDFSGTPSPYHHYFDIRISGTYIRA